MTLEESLGNKDIDELMKEVDTVDTSDLVAMIASTVASETIVRSMGDEEKVKKSFEARKETRTRIAEATDVVMEELDKRIPPRRYVTPDRTHERCVAHSSLGTRCRLPYAHRGPHSFGKAAP